MKNRNKTTKFPVARIKRIMQRDEEVGKVAQATPIVISKALELFLAMVIEEASKVTLERGSKKVEAYHLKHAIDTVEMLDFLKELVEGIPDPSAGGTIELEPEEGRKKRAKGKGKAPAAAANDANGAGAGAGKKRRKGKEKGEPEEAEERPEPEEEENDGDEQGAWEG